MFAGSDCCKDRIEVTWLFEWYCESTKGLKWVVDGRNRDSVPLVVGRRRLVRKQGGRKVPRHKAVGSLASEDHMALWRMVVTGMAHAKGLAGEICRCPPRRSEVRVDRSIRLHG